jgi:hypothetical protein
MEIAPPPHASDDDMHTCDAITTPAISSPITGFGEIPSDPTEQVTWMLMPMLLGMWRLCSLAKETVGRDPNTPIIVTSLIDAGKEAAERALVVAHPPIIAARVCTGHGDTPQPRPHPNAVADMYTVSPHVVTCMQWGVYVSIYIGGVISGVVVVHLLRH